MEIEPDNGEVVPFVFVVPESPGTAIETLRTLEVNRDWRQFLRGPWIWCLQTYLELRNLGYPVVLANEPAPGCVNLIHVRQLHGLRLDPNTFAVSIQADCPDVAPWTPVNIVQNRRQEDGQRSFWIPHWPQPGLLPRSSERNRVKCAAYTGNDDWLAGTERQWSRALGSLGIVFRYLGNDSWNDYSTIDVLIVIRSFDQLAYDFKPPTKLINAWHGQLPLVAGLDSAFSQIGRPGHDYLQVCTWDQAIEAIRSLRDDQARYRSIVDAGAASGLLYTRARIALAWQNLLYGPVRDRYLHWKSALK